MEQQEREAQQRREPLETEIRILPDGAVVIMDLDEGMLEIALALNPQDERLRQRARLLRLRRARSHAAKPNR